MLTKVERFTGLYVSAQNVLTCSGYKDSQNHPKCINMRETNSNSLRSPLLISHNKKKGHHKIIGRSDKAQTKFANVAMNKIPIKTAP